MEQQVENHASSGETKAKPHILFLLIIVFITLVLGTVTLFFLGQKNSSSLVSSGQYVNYFDQLANQADVQSTAYANPFSPSISPSQSAGQYQNPFQ